MKCVLTCVRLYSICICASWEKRGAWKGDAREEMRRIGEEKGKPKPPEIASLPASRARPDLLHEPGRSSRMHRCLAYVIHLPGAATSSYTAILVLRFFSTYPPACAASEPKAAKPWRSSDRIARSWIFWTHAHFTSPYSLLLPFIEHRQTRHKMVGVNPIRFPFISRSVSWFSFLFFFPSRLISRAIIISPFIVCRNIFIIDYPRGVCASQLVHSRPTPSILGLLSVRLCALCT